MNPVSIVSASIVILVIFIVIWIRMNEKGKLDEQKDEFIALAAHYLMTPLSIIKGNIVELTDGKDQKISASELKIRYLNIEASANKLLLLVQNMLIISQIDQGVLRYNAVPLDLDGFIYDCLAEVGAEAERKKIHLKYYPPENRSSLVQIKTDREKLRQGLLNVLSNALKFTGDGGSVEITLVRKNRAFVINVSDSGIGMTNQEEASLFTKFHRGTSYLNMNYEGIGLGLYITKYLIEQGGGTIGIDSEVGKGTSVAITVPFGE